MIASDAHATSVALMKFLSQVARRHGVAEHVYVVGGAVRNFLINQPIKDIDVVIDSIALGRDSEWFAKQVAREIPVRTEIVTDRYGVAKVYIKGPWVYEGRDLNEQVIEIVNARKETYGAPAGKGKGVQYPALASTRSRRRSGQGRDHRHHRPRPPAPAGAVDVHAAQPG
jgi:tRNA nucleotidyltransferase/poly(A) polymerase